jgi:membrane protease YdiL (CAAX protease family)
MADFLASPSGPAAAVPRPEFSAAEKRLRWFEICLVLVIALGGSLFNSLYLLRYGPNALPRTAGLRFVVGFVHEAACLALLGYVLWRRGRRFRDIGLRWSLRDVGMGLVVIVASYVSLLVGSVALDGIHFAIFRTLPTGPIGRDFFSSSVVALPFSLLNPFFEELIVRAYLMTEVAELTGSMMLAVFLSVLVQFSYHLYYGWWAALSLAFQFLVFALYYARYRRALPIIVAHELFDLYALIRLG